MINNTNNLLLRGDAVTVCVHQIMSKIINLNKHNEKKSLLARDKCINMCSGIEVGTTKINSSCCLLFDWSWRHLDCKF